MSVLIPAYNAEAHLAEAIESVSAQRFTDWELIIVDDASTDHTAEVAQKYADGKRIRFYRNERNLGKWPNHNRCTELAHGKYLKFLHADDMLYPHCVEHMVHFMELFPETALVQSHEVNRYLSPRLQMPRDVYQQEFFGLVTLRESPSGIMYRRAAWAAAGGYDPKCDFGAVKLHLCMARAAPALLIYAGLTFYRRGSQQYRHTGPGAILASVGERAWLADVVRHPQCPLSDSEMREALKNLELLARGCQSRARLQEYGWEFWYPLYEATTQLQAGLYPRCQTAAKRKPDFAEQ